jgi:hypothetical protein
MQDLVEVRWISYPHWQALVMSAVRMDAARQRAADLGLTDPGLIKQFLETGHVHHDATTAAGSAR